MTYKERKKWNGNYREYRAKGDKRKRHISALKNHITFLKKASERGEQTVFCSKNVIGKIQKVWSQS